jgi:hypothetical protein
LARFANRPDDVRFQIIPPSDIVENLFRNRIQQQPVNREITALHVLAGVFAETHCIGVAAVAVADIGAEGGDFDYARFPCAEPRDRFDFTAGERVVILALRILRNWNQHNPELRTHCIRLGENAHDLFRSSVGGDVVVSGFVAQQQIAHTSAAEVRLVAVLPQSADDRHRELLRR